MPKFSNSKVSYSLRCLVTTITTVASLFGLCASAIAIPVDEYYIKQALDRYYALPTDARTMALGGSTTTTCNRGECIYLNPAGLGRSVRYELLGAVGRGSLQGEEFLEREQIEQFQNKGYAIGAIPLGEDRERGPQYGNVALGYSRYQGETNDSINTIPDGHRRSIGYGIALDTDWSVGYSFTFYDDQLHSDLADLHSHSRVLHVLGAQYRVSPDTTIGAMFRLGTGQSDTEDYTRRSDGLSRPHELGGLVGVETALSPQVTLSGLLRYQHLRSKGNLSDVSSPVVIGSDEEGSIYAATVGAEYHPIERASIRAGFYYQAVDYEFSRTDLQGLSGNADGPHFSTGLGYVFQDVASLIDDVRVDYAFEYSPVGDGVWEHLLSFGVSF